MRVEQAVDLIWDGLQHGVHYPDALRGQLTLADGYRVQLGVMARAIAAGDAQAGWKIGLSAGTLRQRFCATAPVFGYLLQSRHFATGASFATATIPQAALECELCMTLGETLRGPGITPERVLGAVATVAPAFEIVSLRGDMAADLPLGVADNVSQWAFITGQVLQPYPTELALGQVTLDMLQHGQVVAHLVGAEVIDHQLQSLAWLANQLAEYGLALEAGQQVMTGTFNAPAPLHPGEQWEARFAGIGTVQAVFA
jgi:2-keto-4-pentenoate hydratase